MLLIQRQRLKIKNKLVKGALGKRLIRTTWVILYPPGVTGSLMETKQSEMHSSSTIGP